MTQEEKQLLLIDISSRLPYKVNVLAKTSHGDKIGYIVTVTTKFLWYSKYGEMLGEFYNHEGDECLWLDCGLFKPYLRPMSSMTDEEENELDKTDKESSRIYFNDLHSRVEKYGRDNLRGFLPDYPTLDWLNAHHFDYRGLIEKGLALEAPKGMYES